MNTVCNFNYLYYVSQCKQNKNLSILIATTSGVLAVPLTTTPLEGLVGETAVFSYLIVLTNFSLNVTDTISVVANPFNPMLPNLTLVERGEEVYQFTVPSVSTLMNGLQFTLETLEGIVVSPPITLQVTGRHTMTYRHIYAILFHAIC